MQPSPNCIEGKIAFMVSRTSFLSMPVVSALVPQKPFERIVRSTRPEDLEMPAEGFTDFITPIDHFFVRTHTLVPRVDLAQWHLKVDGHVSKTLDLSMEDLRKLRPIEVVG